MSDTTDEMLNAFLKATGEWIDPYEPATECGVEVECGLSQDDADELNAQSRAMLRKGLSAMNDIKDAPGFDFGVDT